MSSGPTITVLIVDDHYVTRVGLTIILRKSSHITVIGEAENAQDCIEKTKILKPQVVILDIGLPGMSGIEAAKVLKHEFPKTKILMMSSRDDEACVLDALSAGADGYCVKDAAEEQIASAVTSVSLGAGWLHPQIARQVLQIHRTIGQATTPVSPRYRLSVREGEVLQLIVEGLSNQEIARKLGLSSETVKSHVRRMMEKLMVSDRTQAAVKAITESLIIRPDVNEPPTQ